MTEGGICPSVQCTSMKYTYCTWHRTGLEDSWEGRGAREALPSAHPMPAGPRRTCPPRHTWEPAVVGLSGPGLSWGYLKTCCQPVLDRSGAPGRPAPSRGDVGTEARVWEQFILAPHEDLKITPPPSPLGLGRCIRYQYSSRLRPSPSSRGLPYSWTCRVFLVYKWRNRPGKTK